MLTPPGGTPVLDLHLHRHALRAERARVGWWRRLVRARMDLAVAQAAAPQPLGETVAFQLPLDVSLDVPPAAQLGALLAAPHLGVDIGNLPQLRALDEQLARYEAGVDDAIDVATARLVEQLTLDTLTPTRGVQGPADQS